MKEIDEEDFFKLLSSDVKSHNDLLITFKKFKSIDLNKITYSNSFRNCKFRGENFEFMNRKYIEKPKYIESLIFENCEFENQICFRICTIQYVQFENNIKCQKLRIVGSDIEQMYIRESIFRCIDISDNTFLRKFALTDNIIGKSNIEGNQFEKSDFSSNDFGVSANFYSNTFKNATFFDQLKHKGKTTIKIKNCNFFDYVTFNESKLNKLHIETSKFQKFTSFQASTPV